MILHLVFSAVSCSPELFLIFRMSVERKKKSKRARVRGEKFLPFPHGIFQKSISKKEKKKMNRVHLETEKYSPAICNTG